MIWSLLMLVAGLLAGLQPLGPARAGPVEGIRLENSDSSSPDTPTTEHRRVASRVNLLQLNFVDRGKPGKTVLSSSDLQTRSHLTIDGYVSGVVALCADEMAVSVDGRPMAPIRVGADGALWLKNFGRVAEGELLAPNREQPLERAEAGNLAAARRSAVLDGGYAYFPAVAGDAVATAERFTIRFRAGTQQLNLAVQQQGYSLICSIAPEKLLAREPIPFFYAGEPTDRFGGRTAADLDARLKAVAKGIEAVESAFSGTLIDGVTIIESPGRHNAVTCSGSRRIWFYSAALLGEPLDELVVIAEHESLHILVDLLQLTQSTALRELFADLKGYDDLSLERLELLTFGRVARARSGAGQTSPSPLLAFISEKNFLEGARGGHADADLEEFCTSFLHSLMHSDRLEEALRRPLNLGSSRSRDLTEGGRQALKTHYTLTIDAMAGSLNEARRNGFSGAEAAAQLALRLAQTRAVLSTDSR